MSFLSGFKGQQAPRGNSGWNNFTTTTGRFLGNMFDRNNDGKHSWGESLRTGLGFLSPVGLANNLARGGYNMYKDSQTPQWNHYMPEKGGMSGNNMAIGDLKQNMSMPQFGLNGGDMNYTGGSQNFNEKTGQYAPSNSFLSGFNPTSAQYRNMNLQQNRNDAINGYLNSPNGASPFGQLNPGDRALQNHNSFTQGMDMQRFAGDLNQGNAYAEFNAQNAARQKAAMMYK